MKIDFVKLSGDDAEPRRPEWVGPVEFARLNRIAAQYQLCASELVRLVDEARWRERSRRQRLDDARLTVLVERMGRQT